MRSPINLRGLSIALMAASLMVAGCGDGGEAATGANAAPEASGMLRRVRSAAELEQALKTSLPEVLELGPARPPFTAAADGENSSRPRYTAEAGVDEFDYARYDGTNLYVAPTPWSNTQVARAIRILRTDLRAAPRPK